MPQKSKTIRFNKKALDELPIPEGADRPVYHDETVKGLSLRITSKGTITFFIQKRDANQKNIKTTVGRYPSTTIPRAREIAMKLLTDIAEGINPNDKKRDASSKRAITLGKVFADYMVSRGTNLQPSTKKGYTSTFNKYLSDWSNKPFAEITRDMVEERHRQITKEFPTTANNVMRHLRAYSNYAMGEYEDANGVPLFTYNPVKRLNHVKAWNREKSRRTVVKNYDLKRWHEAIISLPEHQKKRSNSAEVCRDLFLFILFTGLRRREASNLMWSDIDLNDNSFTIEDTKNHEPHSLPLTKPLLEILERRKSDSPYVFQGRNPDKPIQEPKKQVTKVREISGVFFDLHTLRRTFGTIAESLDINSYALKKLLNHKNQRDVTGRYIVTDMERLREPMNRITNHILEQIR